jgi:hypothetical protein
MEGPLSAGSNTLTRRRENPLYKQASAEKKHVILAAENSVKTNLGHKTRKEGR